MMYSFNRIVTTLYIIFIICCTALIYFYINDIRHIDKTEEDLNKRHIIKTSHNKIVNEIIKLILVVSMGNGLLMYLRFI